MPLMLEGCLVVIADDEAPIREMLKDMLEEEGAQVRAVGSGAEALVAIQQQEPDVAILDVRMPDPDGLATLQQLRAKGVDLPVLIITAQDSSTVTIEAMQRGAYDYLAKPFNYEEIMHTIQRAVEHRRLTRRLADLERKIGEGPDPRDIMIGRSSAMQQVYKLIGRVAASDATVLITGESGTGKELVAQVLHRTSPRSGGPFVAVNCAALPETLLESELFGHEKGAFTGAMAQRKGRFEQAAKGSLFLDEIGEITPTTQKKLLRVLQERTFERVGGNTAVKADVRVIAATNRDLLAEAESGRFREDLYYRLNVVNIHMPPLRDRKDDIPLLVEHFLHKHRFGAGSEPARLSEAAMVQLGSYEWPGNVRQLENTIERAVVLAQGGLIGPDHLLLGDIDVARDQVLVRAFDRLLDMGGGLEAMLSEVRRRLILRALDRHAGDRNAVARALGISDSDLP